MSERLKEGDIAYCGPFKVLVLEVKEDGGEILSYTIGPTCDDPLFRGMAIRREVPASWISKEAK